jgi:N-acetylmuramoyl-L-alanine amidase
MLQLGSDVRNQSHFPLLNRQLLLLITGITPLAVALILGIGNLADVGPPLAQSTERSIGIQAGHWKQIGATGATSYCDRTNGSGGTTEVSVNRQVAEEVVRNLKERGYNQSVVLSAEGAGANWTRDGYARDAFKVFVSVHLDNRTRCSSDPAGFKVAGPSDQLVDHLWSEYEKTTAFPRDGGNITISMTHYYAFNYLSEDTAKAIIEMGYLSNPDELAFVKSEKGQRQMAYGIANSIECFLDAGDCPAIDNFPPHATVFTIQSTSLNAKPKAKMNLTFTLRNTGYLTWRSELSYTLKHAGGLDFELAATQPLPASVEPFHDIQWTLPIVAPGEPGIYETRWQMTYEDGRTRQTEVIGPEVVFNVNVGTPDLGDTIRQFIEQAIQEARQRLEALLASLVQQIVDRFREELARVFPCLQCLMVPAIVTSGLIMRSQRRRKS